MLTKDAFSIFGPKTLDLEEKFRLREQRVKKPTKTVSSANKETNQYNSQISPIKRQESPMKVYHSKILRHHLKHRRNEAKELIFTPDLPFSNKAEEKLECQCNICIAQNQIKPEIHELPIDEFFKGFDFNTSPRTIGDYDRDFVFLLKRLIPPRHASQSLRLLIPDTLVFTGGYPLMIVRTGQVIEEYF